MECPKCHKSVSESDDVCSNCGVTLKDKKTKNFKKIVKNKKDKAKSGFETVKKKAVSKKAKTVYIILSVVLVVLLVLVLVAHFTDEKGNKIASEYAEFIGMKISEAESETGYNLKEDAVHRCLNSAMNFDEIYECEDEITVEDISFPKWAVTVNNDNNKKIDSVVYTDFTQIKDDLRGEKKDKCISLEKFNKGAKFNAVSDEIDLEPYSITYKKNNVVYAFKYYYITDYGDAQSVILSVTFDDDNKYLNSTEKLVYPQNL